MSRPTKPSTILNKAADLIVEEGWVRGAMMCKAGKHCAVGAIAAVTGDLQQTWQERWGIPQKGEEISNVVENPSPQFMGAVTFLQGTIGIDSDMNPRFYSNTVDYYVAKITNWNDSEKTKRKKVVDTLREAAAVAKKAKR